MILGKTTLLTMLMLLATLDASAATHRVPSDYATIQAGVDACAVSDTVLVAAGTYTGEGNRAIDFHGVDLVLMSESGPEKTVIDCEDEHRGIFLQNNETRSSVVQGFKIINANPYNFAGGGIACDNASPTLRGLVIVNCEAAGGGAIALSYSSAILIDLVLENNIGRNDGGAIYTYDVDIEIRDTIIKDNWANWGGGISVSSSQIHIQNTLIEGNIAANAGGGVYVHLNSEPTIIETRFIDNTAVTFAGGGIAFYGDSGTVRDCEFTGNRSGWYGGAIDCENEDATPLIENCIFTGNISDIGGGAIFIRMRACPTMRNCTLNENIVMDASTGVIQTAYWGTGIFENVIISNTAHGFGIHGGNPFAELTMSCCNVFGNEAGNYGGLAPDMTGINGNISEDPQFCGIPGSGNIYLQSDSPCAPDNNDCAVQIGAMPVGCGVTAAEKKSFGEVKSLY